MTTNTVRIGAVDLTRVGYIDVTVPPDAVGLTAAEVTAASWADPAWSDGDQVRVGAAAWVIQSGDARIVVDPLGAADDLLRGDGNAAMHQDAYAALLAEAGLPRESFTHAIATHLDGIGMFAWRNDDGSWAPFFPNAPILMTQRELDRVDALMPQGAEVLGELRALGVVQAVTDDFVDVAPGVALEFTGGHSAGHQVVRIDSGGEHAVMLGHLAVSALSVATEECPGLLQHEDAVDAQKRLEAIRAEDVVLVGPLWPAPGAARWDGKRLIPVS